LGPQKQKAKKEERAASALSPCPQNERVFLLEEKPVQITGIRGCSLHLHISPLMPVLFLLFFI
jgi:hypothetical protein